MKRSPAMVLGFVVLGASTSFATHALEPAKYVTAKEITGVVVEANTGKPIPNAIVAIRFERNNTGHSGAHCFRSMAVEADREGRFRFAPWTQENTKADATFGELTAYKAGFSEPSRPVYVKQSRRSIFNIPFSDTIEIPKTEVRLEVAPFTGNDADRIGQLRRLVGNFICRQAVDDMILLTRIREEIVSSSIGNQKPQSWDATVSKWIEEVIKHSSARK